MYFSKHSTLSVKGWQFKYLCTKTCFW